MTGESVLSRCHVLHWIKLRNGSCNDDIRIYPCPNVIIYFAVAPLKIFNFEALYNHQYNIWFLALITTMEL